MASLMEFIPELEEYDRFNGLMSATDCFSAESSIKMLEICGEQRRWEDAMDDERLKMELERPHDPRTGVRYRVLYVLSPILTFGITE
jgi:hypothetical protein